MTTEMKIEKIKEVISTSQRGIKKRIDENRELIELLQREVPDLLTNKPWVLDWLASQDEFLVDLMNACDVVLNPNEKQRVYPRELPKVLKDRLN